jgi:SPOR domain
MINMSSESKWPGGLPLFLSGWGAGRIPFGAAETFWDDAGRVIADGLLGDSLDAAMAGKSSPRVWLFLHEPGEGRLSIAAALSVAQELAIRDQAVLLLDGDDDHADLTNWAGRTDQDGWIDLVRYGSSVLNCGIPMPFDGRRGYLLGIGSFSPVDVTGPEVADLLTRLKRQADDVLVVAPADAVGRLWAAEADVRLLSWDRAQRSVDAVEGLLETFTSAGFPVTGLVGFGLPGKPEPEADGGAIEKESFVEASGPEPGETPPQEETVPPGETVPRLARGAIREMEEQVDEDFRDEEAFAKRKGNSSVFWIVAIVSLAMISVVSIYYLKYLRVPADGHFPAEVQNEVMESGTAPLDSGYAALTEDPDVEYADDGADEQLALLEDGSGPEGVDVPLDTEVGKPADDPVDRESSDLVTIESGPAPETESAPEANAHEDEFAMGPYLEAVGSAGWSLHVYSFPDSLQAEAESRVLAARGFRSATRTVQFKDKGRWYRLYLGSFSTKTEARAAGVQLMEKLGEDWANPVRF